MSTLKQIEETLEEMKKNNCTEEEILVQLQEFFPKTIVEVEKVNPRKEYQAEWYKTQQKIKAISDKERQEQEKLNKAKQRTKGFCYICKKVSPIIAPQVKLETKRGYIKKIIIIESICQFCNKKMRNYGGLL